MAEKGSDVVDESLRTRDDNPVTAVVQLAEPKLETSSASDRTEELRTNASQAQEKLTELARQRNGMQIQSQFWITNAALVEIDTTAVSLDEIARIPEVVRIHENFEVEAIDGREDGQSDTSTLSHGTHTYGLEQINVPDVWDQIGTQGNGARVAVLDTGIDGDHEALDLADGGWAEFDANGNQIDSDPYDSGSHGTHVSGTVAGGVSMENDTHIGVAPNVELYHGGVLTDQGKTFGAIVGGIQWAVEQNADVINMSLGGPTDDSMITPLQNAQSAGTFPVCSAGNDGEGNGSTGSPGNVYGAGIAVGASNDSRDIAGFSSGEQMQKSDWSDPPDSWPDTYIVPDVSAPGVSTYSSVPNDGYDGTFDGTSMASPHVAGVVALMVAASGGSATPQRMWDILESTASKPDDWTEGDAEWAIDGKDSRYGEGIIDALAAVKQVAFDTGVTGVIESSGEAVSDVSVTLAGKTTTTDDSGSFEVLAEPGSYDLTASGTGIKQTTKSVTVEDSGSITDVGTITVDSAVDIELGEGQATKIEGSESITVTADVYNVETLRIELTGGYAESDASLTVNTESENFGEDLSFDGYSGALTVEVGTTGGTSGDFSLDHVLSGQSTQQTVSTGPTTVYESLTEIGVIDAGNNFGTNIARVLTEQLPESYRVSTTTTNTVTTDPDTYDAVVAQKLASDGVGNFVGTVESADIGVVYLDQWDNAANAIPQFQGESSAVTGTSESDSTNGAENPVSYKATIKNPILGDIAAGNDVEIHSAEYVDHTWFTLASESGFDVLADVKHATGTAGSALAINEETQTVLASSLGRSSYVGDSDFTGEADAILARAVQSVDGQSDVLVTAAASYNAGQLQLDVQADSAEKIMIDGVWTDWQVESADLSSSFSDNITETGNCTWSWGTPKDSVSPSATISLPEDVYVGGTFEMTVSAAGPSDEAETAVQFTVE
jgi:subtilisin family serine protease